MDPIFLTLYEVIEIHSEQIELYGGLEGLRDPAALESAVATPAATFEGQYLHETIPAMAAAYLFAFDNPTWPTLITSTGPL
jgi:death-on-curing protein